MKILTLFFVAILAGAASATPPAVLPIRFEFPDPVAYMSGLYTFRPADSSFGVTNYVVEASPNGLSFPLAQWIVGGPREVYVGDVDLVDPFTGFAGSFRFSGVDTAAGLYIDDVDVVTGFPGDDPKVYGPANVPEPAFAAAFVVLLSRRRRE